MKGRKDKNLEEDIPIEYQNLISNRTKENVRKSKKRKILKPKKEKYGNSKS